MRENRLRWFDHIECKSNDAPVKIVEKIDIAHGKNLREKPKTIIHSNLHFERKVKNTYMFHYQTKPNQPALVPNNMGSAI